ncbi:hypothetical protein PM082_023185 [Marasmius tenuissimus]|nr:hypothetical protein PM082_023185 [Marasmius tenuissimus]
MASDFKEYMHNGSLATLNREMLATKTATGSNHAHKKFEESSEKWSSVARNASLIYWCLILGLIHDSRTHGNRCRK